MAKTKPRISSKVRAQAVSLLSQWAKEGHPVKYIAAGLRYHGVLSDVSDKSTLAYDFNNNAGIDARILPSYWETLKIDNVGQISALHVTDKFVGEYSILPGRSRQSSAADEVSKVREQLVKWQARQTRLYIVIDIATMGFMFFGKIAKVSDGLVVIDRGEQKDLMEQFAISFESAICTLEGSTLAEIGLLHLSTGTRVRISEKYAKFADVCAALRRHGSPMN